MRRVALVGVLEGFFLTSKKLHQQPQFRFAATRSEDSPGLVNHCLMVRRIMQGQEPEHVRCRRIQNIVRKIETNYINWLNECGPKESLLVLETLTSASRCLKKKSPTMVGTIGQEQQQPKKKRSGVKEDWEWSGASPYFSTDVNDWLCVLLSRSAENASRPDEWLVLLWAAAELELADTQTLQYLCRQLTRQDYTRSASHEELVRVLQLVSLLVKRCRMPIPKLDYLLCRLPSASLDSRQSLNVLSSLLRLRERNSVDVVRSVSRRAVVHVATYTPKDVIYALEAIALLNCCHESYAGAVLSRCTALHAELKPTELGSICKYVAMLNPSRTNNDVAFCCAKELRRLLPALLSRTEELLGCFSLRDARCVLNCLQQHKVHHSVVFSLLTPLVSEK